MINYQIRLKKSNKLLAKFPRLKLTHNKPLIAAFTDSSDESAAPSSFSDSASRHNNNDWLTDDDDDDDDDVMDESQLNSQPAAKAAGSKPKTAAVPLTTSTFLSIVKFLGKQF